MPRVRASNTKRSTETDIGKRFRAAIKSANGGKGMSFSEACRQMGFPWESDVRHVLAADRNRGGTPGGKRWARVIQFIEGLEKKEAT